MTGQSRSVNHRSSKSFNGLGRFQPHALHKHLLRGSRLDRSILRREFEQVIRLGLGAVLRASVRRHRRAQDDRCALRSIRPKWAMWELTTRGFSSKGRTFPGPGGDRGCELASVPVRALGPRAFSAVRDHVRLAGIRGGPRGAVSDVGDPTGRRTSVTALRLTRSRRGAAPGPITDPLRADLPTGTILAPAQLHVL